MILEEKLLESDMSMNSNENNIIVVGDSNISASEKAYIIEGCECNLRLDGRGCLEYRPYTLIQNAAASCGGEDKPIFVLANGSSRFLLPGGSTDIVCSVKAELVRPRPSHPNEGLLELQVDTSSIWKSSENKREGRNEEMELSSLLSHLHLPHVVDKQALCLVPGSLAWRLFIDVLVVSCDGNVLDSCSHAIRSALLNTLLPIVTPVTDNNDGPQNSEADHNNNTRKKKKISDEFIVDGDVTHAIVPKGAIDCPIIVSIYLIPKKETYTKSAKQHTGNTLSRMKKRTAASGGKVMMILDSSSEEEACASTKVSVSVDPQGRICGVYKYANASDGSGTMLFGMLTEITNVAVATSKRVYEMIDRSTYDGGWLSSTDNNHSSRQGKNHDNNNVEGGNLLSSHFELR